MSASTFGRVDSFIESLKLPVAIATVLFESDEDCHLFFSNYYMRNISVTEDLEDFRDYKIKKSKKTLDLFVKECYTINMRQAFESTFYRPFEDWKIDLVSEAILNGKTSLDKLFTDFQKNPDKNILKNVL
jgi:hypothetical protein